MQMSVPSLHPDRPGLDMLVRQTSSTFFDKIHKLLLAVFCSVVEGDSMRAVDNELVGRFEVSGLAPLPSGVDVLFAVNDSGIIEVMMQPLI